MPPIEPQGGTGPVNYAAGQPDSPFSAFTNQINYANMARYQAVSQYAQTNPTMMTMPMNQQYRVVNEPQFQYGVNSGQDWRIYRRESEINQLANKSALSSGILAGATLFGGWSSMIATIPLSMAIENGLEQSRIRQMYNIQMASSIDRYRERLGLNALSYSQATSLGMGLTNQMYSGNNPFQANRSAFFNVAEQSRILQTGMASGLLTAQGPGRGTADQFMKNAKEFINTVESLSKTLKTTSDGAMSIINELKNTGFKTMQSIKQQVTQATAFGQYTGLGSQNMMQLGAAGAQAVQGTMWTAQAGAQQYQAGAFQASQLARTSYGANLVERAGGIGQAGATLGNFTMNVLGSNMGNRMFAYAMNSQGQLDPEKMRALLRGDVSSYGVVTGSSAVGYGMGSERVLFPLYKARAAAQMGPQDLQLMQRTTFNKWREHRRGSLEAQAFVFAQQFNPGGSIRDQELMMQSLIGNAGWVDERAAAQAQRAIDASPNIPLDPTAAGMRMLSGMVGKGIYQNFGQPTELIAGGIERGARYLTQGVRRVGERYEDIYGAPMWAGIAGMAGGALIRGAVGMINPELRRQMEYGTTRYTARDRALGIRRQMGVETWGGTAAGAAAIGGLTERELNRYKITPVSDAELKNMGVTINTAAMTGEAGTEALRQMVAEQATGGMGGLDALLKQNNQVRQIFGLTNKTLYGNPVLNEWIKENSERLARTAVVKHNTQVSDMKELLDRSQTSYNQIVKKEKLGTGEQVMMNEYIQSATTAAMTGMPMPAAPGGMSTAVISQAQTIARNQARVNYAGDIVGMTNIGVAGAQARLNEVAINMAMKETRVQDIEAARSGGKATVSVREFSDMLKRAGTLKGEVTWMNKDELARNVIGAIQSLPTDVKIQDRLKKASSWKGGVIPAEVAAGDTTKIDLRKLDDPQLRAAIQANAYLNSAEGKAFKDAKRDVDITKNLAERSAKAANIVATAGFITGRPLDTNTQKQIETFVMGGSDTVSTELMKSLTSIGIGGSFEDAIKKGKYDTAREILLGMTESGAGRNIQREGIVREIESLNTAARKIAEGAKSAKYTTAGNVEKDINKDSLSMLVSANAALLAAYNPVTGTPGQPGIQTNVNPPVLNYWNNRWIL